jgi:transporter family-2 protein
VNSQLSARVGYVVATVVIHIAGLIGVTIVSLFKREQVKPGRLPFYYYIGGVVGVGTVYSSIYAFTMLSASLAIALALLGQTLASIVVDAVGFLGRKKYPLTARRLPGILLAITGVVFMAENWQTNALAMLVALASGALPTISVSLNSELGLRKGLFRSTRINYITGLGTALVVLAVVRPPAVTAAQAVLAAGPFLALSGGLIGVGVVSGMSTVFAHMQAFAATLLAFSGQGLTGVLIDYIREGSLDARKLVGTLVLLAGLALNALLSRPRAPDAAPAVRRRA